MRKLIVPIVVVLALAAAVLVMADPCGPTPPEPTPPESAG